MGESLRHPAAEANASGTGVAHHDPGTEGVVKDHRSQLAWWEETAIALAMWLAVLLEVAQAELRRARRWSR